MGLKLYIGGFKLYKGEFKLYERGHISEAGREHSLGKGRRIPPPSCQLRNKSSYKHPQDFEKRLTDRC